MPEAEDRIVAHHVGARGFSVAFNCPPTFADDVVHIVYEADAECAQAMMMENTRSNFHILPYCLGRQDRQGKLFVTKNPYASSNLRPNPHYANWYCELHLHAEVDGVALHGECYDVVYGNDGTIVTERDVAIRSLDSILDERLGVIPPPDFLSLDTQGSELEILLGSERAFNRSCLGLATEISFHPMYQGQALFSSIFDFALRHGFYFAGFTYLQEISPNKLPIGARAGGFVAFGDAIFLRSIESTIAKETSPEEQYLSLFKLSFIALNLGYLEYAIQAAAAALAADPDDKLRAKLEARKCFRVIFALVAALQSVAPKFPHTERSEMTEEKRRLLEREAVNTALATSKRRIGPQNFGMRHIASRVMPPVAYDALRYGWRKVRPVLPTAVTHKLRSPLGDGSERRSTSRIEQILMDHGYVSLAETVRTRRQSAEHCVAGQMY